GNGAAPVRAAVEPVAAEPVALDVSPPVDDAQSVPEPLLAAEPSWPVEVVPEPPAAAMPESVAAEPLSEEGEQQLVVVYGVRRYRVRGWPKQLGEALKVNVLVTDSGNAEALHVDTLDLYQAK